MIRGLAIGQLVCNYRAYLVIIQIQNKIKPHCKSELYQGKNVPNVPDSPCNKMGESECHTQCCAVPAECPTDPISACSTCCCKSSVELYDPTKPDPECTADSALYEMKFTGTWSPTCHPGDYNSYSIFTPVWSWPVAVSHNTQYKLWDACMDDVSVGVGLLSQIVS